jgi:hypothetical protein
MEPQRRKYVLLQVRLIWFSADPLDDHAQEDAMKLHTRSASRRRPAFSNSSTAIAVNAFVSEPIRNRVVGVFGTWVATLAPPKPPSRMRRPRSASSTATLNWWFRTSPSM